MGTRTVRLDEETEKSLEEIRRLTGLSIFEVLKRGILALREQVHRMASTASFEIYRELDIGEGGYAIAPSTDVRRGVGEALKKKHER